MANRIEEKPVLVVDDNPMSLKLARVLLEIENYQVRTAVSAEEALQVLKGFQPRLILLDLQLPGMNGVELTRQLRTHPQYRNVPILIVTSFAHEDWERQARAAGCDAYILKPIDTKTLPLVVGRYFGKGSNGSEAGNKNL